MNVKLDKPFYLENVKNKLFHIILSIIIKTVYEIMQFIIYWINTKKIFKIIILKTHILLIVFLLLVLYKYILLKLNINNTHPFNKTNSGIQIDLDFTTTIETFFQFQGFQTKEGSLQC